MKKMNRNEIKLHPQGGPVIFVDKLVELIRAYANRNHENDNGGINPKFIKLYNANLKNLKLLESEKTHLVYLLLLRDPSLEEAIDNSIRAIDSLSKRVEKSRGTLEEYMKAN